MLTASRVIELLSYDPKTGIFKWKQDMGNATKKGDICNYRRSGYISIRIDGKNYSAHRLAWLYFYGFMPIQIDHINGIKDDNRLSNLRIVTIRENNKNKRLGKNNTSGCFGVTWNKNAKKWRVFIKNNGKNKHLGYFDDKDEAIKIRKEAEIKYGYHENHGKIQENKLGLIK